MALNVVLMVCWIVLLAHMNAWSALTIGTVVFALILVVSGFYLCKDGDEGDFVKGVLK